MTHSSRDTTTGLDFEKLISMPKVGINLTKHKLYSYLKEQGIKWQDYISKKLLPDEAYLDITNNQVIIYEKKFQQTHGSADEKPQTCAFKIYEYRKLFSSLGIKNVYYIYIFNDWFKKSEYKDMLDYINSVDGCSYMFL